MIYIFPNLICVSVVEIRSCSPRTTDIWLGVIAWSYTYLYINIRILIRMSYIEFLKPVMLTSVNVNITLQEY